MARAAIKPEQIDYAVEVLSSKLVEDAGQWVAHAMLERAGEEGDLMSSLFGGLMKDSSLDEHVHALNTTIQLLKRMKGAIGEAGSGDE